MRTSLLRQSALGVIAASLLLAAPTAFAGEISIEESSIIDIENFQIEKFGKWTLAMPHGTRVSNRRDSVQLISSANEGQYTLKVMPPDGARTTMIFSKDDTVLQTVEGTEFTFLFSGDGRIDVLLEYRYEGIAEIESDPQGVSFELSGPQGFRQIGITPETVEHLPPFSYTVNFGAVEGCKRLKPLTRVLEPDNRLRFFGDFQCDDVTGARVFATSSADNSESERSVSSASSSLEPEPEEISFDLPNFDDVFAEPTEPNVSLSHSVNQAEAIAGGTVQVTIGVRNIGTTTLHNVIVTELFDSTSMSLPDVLPQGGERQLGNLAMWEIPTIFAGQSWSVTIPVRMNEHLKQGDRPALTARVSGAEVQAPTDAVLSESIVVGVVTLPATGVRFDLLLLALAAGASLILTLTTRRKKLVDRTA